MFIAQKMHSAKKTLHIFSAQEHLKIYSLNLNKCNIVGWTCGGAY
jgi:hypothetical protein